MHRLEVFLYTSVTFLSKTTGILIVAVTCRLTLPNIPIIEVSLTGGSDGGIIFIQNHCPARITTTTAEMFTFDGSTCTNVPALVSSFIKKLDLLWISDKIFVMNDLKL